MNLNLSFLKTALRNFYLKFESRKNEKIYTTAGAISVTSFVDRSIDLVFGGILGGALLEE